MFTDYLGSILKVVDGNGNTKEEQSFDAWGRKRNPANWQVYDAPEDALPKTLTWLNRGYTGHEHLYQFGIINMNNRLYDPIVGRMLAVDNFVADSESTQAYNRYSYVMNNPLKYTDPSGDLIQNGIRNLINGDPFLFNSGNALVMNTIQAAFSFGIGQAAMPFGVSLLAHGHLGGVMTAVQGGKYHQGFLSASAGSLVGHGAGKIGNTAIRFGVSTLGAGVVGGGASNLAGGNFWDGFRNGVISASLNHFFHKVQADILSKQLEKVFENYPIDDNNEISVEEAFKRVNPAAHKLHLDGDPNYQNACATRLSLAFAKAGVKIPKGYGGLKDVNGNRIIVSAYQMQKFMSTKYGSLMTAYKQSTSTNGIYIGLTPPNIPTTGHVTIIKTGFLSNTYSSGMRATYFWPIK